MGWYDPDWGMRQETTIFASEVDSVLTDYPQYFDLSRHGSDLFDNAKVGLADGRVTKWDEVTEVAIEVVSFDTGADEGECYAAVPVVDNLTNTSMFFYFNNPAASAYAIDDPFGAENVWVSFAAVWHMEDNLDSTANDNDGSIEGDATFTTGGQMGKALDLDGADDHLDVGNSSSLKNLTAFTIETWIYPISNGEGTGGRVIEKAVSYAIHLHSSGTSFRFIIDDGIPTGGTTLASSSGAFALNEWHQIGGVYNNTNMSTFADGAIDTTTARSGSTGTNNDIVVIGIRDDLNREFEGFIDELRFSDVARTPDWIASTYSNQKLSSGFYEVGTTVFFANILLSRIINSTGMSGPLTKSALLNLGGF